MAFEIDLSSRVAAPVETVWKLLVDPATWPSWWDECAEARTADFKPLREGSELEVLLRPKGRETTYRPVVDMMTEHRAVSFTHRTPWVAFTVAWYLAAGEAGTQVTVHGVFAGPGSFLCSLARRTRDVRATLRGNLRGLKKIAERMR